MGDVTELAAALVDALKTGRGFIAAAMRRRGNQGESGLAGEWGREWSWRSAEGGARHAVTSVCLFHEGKIYQARGEISVSAPTR